MSSGLSRFSPGTRITTFMVNDASVSPNAPQNRLITADPVKDAHLIISLRPVMYEGDHFQFATDNYTWFAYELLKGGNLWADRSGKTYYILTAGPAPQDIRNVFIPGNGFIFVPHSIPTLESIRTRAITSPRGQRDAVVRSADINPMNPMLSPPPSSSRVGSRFSAHVPIRSSPLARNSSQPLGGAGGPAPILSPRNGRVTSSSILSPTRRIPTPYPRSSRRNKRRSTRRRK